MGYVTVQKTGANISSAIVETHEFHAENFCAPSSRALASPGNVLYNDANPGGNGCLGDTLLTYPDLYEGKDYHTDVGTAGSIIRTVDRVFGPSGWSVEPCQENTTFADGSSALTATKLFYYDATFSGTPVAVAYQFGNQTDVYEYDFNAWLPVTPGSQQSFPIATCYTTPPNTRTRRSHTDYKQDPTYLSSAAFPSPFLPSLPVEEQVWDTSGPLTDVTTSYDGGSVITYGGITTAASCGTTSPGPRGNATSVSQVLRDLPGGTTSMVSESYAYDCVGNLRTYTDPKQFSTNFQYGDNFVGVGSPGATYAYRTLIQLPNNASVSRDYDYSIGKVRDEIDPNGLTTTFDYSDSLNRLVHILRGNGASGTIPADTKVSYTDIPGSVSVQLSRDQYGADLALSTTTSYDAFGREVQSTSNGADTIITTTAFDGLGRVYSRANPQKDGISSLTDGSSSFTYDAVGRVLKSQEPDGSAVNTGYYTSTNQDTQKPVRTTVITDEAGRQRTLQYDGLGRLVGVVDPVSRATYTYDGLDNMTATTQADAGTGASQTRQFVYDSLKRLRSATNPESGSISYTYDSNGNLTSKTDGRATTCYGNLSGSVCDNSGYDNMNRVTRITFSSINGTATPSVQYCYDGFGYLPNTGTCGQTKAQNQWLRRTAVAAWQLTNGSPTDVSFTTYSYDIAGRLTNSTQSTAGSSNPYPFTYTYYNDDSFASIEYPSGRTVTTCYDTDGRVKWVDRTLNSAACQSGSSASSVAYASISAYWPHGAPQTSQLGNGIVENTTYNSRLQQTGLTAVPWLTLGYSYSSGGPSCTSNNGNLCGQSITMTETSGANLQLRQDYGYDGANRLTSVQESVISGLPAGVSAGNWNSTFWYDGFGNMWGNSTLPLAVVPASKQSQYNAATNRLVSRPNDAALPSDAYDGAGNLQDHPDLGQMTYDAQNRIVAYSNNGSSPISFAYDGEGRRVTKTGAGGTTTYVYDGFGHLAAEYGGATDSGTQYLTADQLGSTRLVTDSNGAVVQRLDYQPFGGVMMGSPTEGNRDLVTGYSASTGLTIKFTGKERDAETGLDYFGARYFSSAQGRCTSPDWSAVPQPVPYAKLENPQSLNLYQYVLNNPLSQKDDDGHEIIYADGLKNTQLVRDTVTAILANPNTSSYLSGYVGSNAPNLTIQSGDLGPPTVQVLPNGQTLTTTVQGNTAPDIQTTTMTNNGVKTSETTLTGATITIDNNTSKGDTPGVMIHESVHAGEAQQNPAGFTADAKAERGQPHDSRPQEQRANAVRHANEKDINKAVKQIEKDRKKDQ